MPRFDGARERIHQPMWDMAVRGIGVSSVINSVRLFANPNTSSEEFTNMATAGALQSDQTYVVKAIRALEFFQSLKDDSAFGAYGNPQLLPSLNGPTVAADNDRAADLYNLLSYGCHLTFKAGEKDQFTSQLVYTPAGMGVFGSSTVTNRNIISNGWPSHENVLLLAKDIPLPARQGFSVRLDFFPFKPINGSVPGAGAGTTAGTAGEGNQATAYTAALDPLAYLNAFDGIKMLGVILDGIKTRDVQ
jgi:hypothetical protein